MHQTHAPKRPQTTLIGTVALTPRLGHQALALMRARTSAKPSAKRYRRKDRTAKSG